MNSIFSYQSREQNLSQAADRCQYSILKIHPEHIGPTVISLRQQVKKCNRSNLTWIQGWPIRNNFLLETSSYKILHYNMWLQFSGKGLSSTNILSHNFILLSILTLSVALFFHPSAGEQSLIFAQPVSVSFCNLLKLYKQAKWRQNSKLWNKLCSNTGRFGKKRKLLRRQVTAKHSKWCLKDLRLLCIVSICYLLEQRKVKK